MMTDEFDLTLFDAVTESKRTLNGKNLSIVLLKSEAKEDYWPRLTKEKLKLNYVKTDFGKWKDQDEQEEEEVPVEEEQPRGVRSSLYFLLRRNGTDVRFDLASWRRNGWNGRNGRYGRYGRSRWHGQSSRRFVKSCTDPDSSRISKL